MKIWIPTIQHLCTPGCTVRSHTTADWVRSPKCHNLGHLGLQIHRDRLGSGLHWSLRCLLVSFVRFSNICVTGHIMDHRRRKSLGDLTSHYQLLHYVACKADGMKSHLTYHKWSSGLAVAVTPAAVDSL